MRLMLTCLDAPCSDQSNNPEHSQRKSPSGLPRRFEIAPTILESLGKSPVLNVVNVNGR